ncbi:hypothetical protein LJK87_42645 [Paenibacillus sp. P25]|nr:hypothetical protein LJK87_42645 [Paenibacillus sp. P25]
MYVGRIGYEKWQVTRNATEFFSLLIGGQWEQAADLTLAGAYQGDPERQQSRRMAWIERMTALKEQGFYPVAYRHVTADFDDGCVCTGHVDLTFQHGDRTVTYRTVFTLHKDYRVNQVCPLSPSGDAVETNGWKSMACFGD